MPAPDSIDIQSPAEGATFLAGSTVPVEVTASSANIRYRRCSLSLNGEELVGRDTVDSSLAFDYELPPDVVGDVRLLAVGIGNDGGIRYDSLSIHVTTSAQLDSIGFIYHEMWLPDGRAQRLFVNGYYNDGITRDVSTLQGVGYASLNSGIADVIGTNVVLTLQPGAAFIVASLGGFTDTLRIEVYEEENIHVAAFSVSNSVVCGAGSVEFTDDSEGSPISRSWQFEGGSPSSSSDPSPEVYYSTSGVHDVTLITIWSDKVDTLFAPGHVVVSELPSVTIEAEDGAVLCQGNETDLIAIGSSGIEHYFWSTLDTTQSLLAQAEGQYTVLGIDENGCVASDTLSISYVAPPQAGADGDSTLCTAAFGPFDLLTRLAGTPEAGGAWQDPFGQPFDGSYDAATDSAGTYTYTVQGAGTCPDASATVTISLVQAASAGVSTTTTVCEDGAAVDLVTALGTMSQGTWTDGNGDPFSGVYDPLVNDPGTFRYVVDGTAPCINDTAYVTVVESTAANAGINGAVTVCSTNGPVDLLTALGGSPDLSGSWTDPGSLPHAGSFIPGTDTPGTYTYSVPGSGNCAGAMATVEVVVNSAPFAGLSDTLLLCSSSGPVDLATGLGGVPDQNGIWTLDGVPHASTFDPNLDVPGIYVYTVSGISPCPDASATAEVLVTPAMIAGIDTTFSLCNSAEPLDLSTVLGQHDVGGTWADPNGNAFGGTYDPAVDGAGSYVYTVSAIGPCAADQASVTITEVEQLSAGGNGSLTICEIDPGVDLFTLLSDSPDIGGLWTGPGGVFNGTFEPSVDSSGTYTYFISSPTPCLDASASIVVTVVAPSNAGVSTNVDVCADGAPIDLFSQLQGMPELGGAWTDPNGDPFAQTFYPDGDLPGTYTYTIAGIFPCPSDSSYVSINVHSAPAQPIAINGAPSLCSDSTGHYWIDPVIDATAYTWSVGSGWSILGNGPSVDITSGLLADTVAVQVTNNCGSSPLQILVVSLDYAPAQPVVLGPDSICSGDTAMLSVSAPQPGVTYTWSLGGTGDTASVTAAGVYFVTASNTCGTVVSSSVDLELVLVEAPGSITGPPAVSPNETVSYSIPEIPSATAYVWSVPLDWQVLSTGDTITFLTDATNSTELLCVYAMVGDCVGPDTCVVVSFTTGFVAGDGTGWFAIVPNPSQGILQLVPTGTMATTTWIEVYDGLGQLVQPPFQFAGDKRVVIDMGDHADGLYFVKATQAGVIRISQFILNR